MNKATIEKELMALKSELVDTENNIMRNEGRLEGLYSELKKEINSKCTNKTKLISEANEKLESLQEQIEKDSKKINLLMQKIQEETQDWDDE